MDQSISGSTWLAGGGVQFAQGASDLLAFSARVISARRRCWPALGGWIRALLYPVRHGSEEAQQDLLRIKLRDSLVRARVGGDQLGAFHAQEPGLHHAQSLSVRASTKW